MWMHSFIWYLDGSKEISVFANTINMMIDTIKYSRKNLINNQNKLKLILEMSPTAVRIVKNDGEKIVFANNAYLKLLGITLEELPNKTPKSYYPKETIYQDLLISLNKNETVENRLIPLKINGAEIWVIATYMNIVYDRGTCTNMCIISDLNISADGYTWCNVNIC